MMNYSVNLRRSCKIATIITILTLAFMRSTVSAKSYIESCLSADKCNAILSYELKKTMKVSQIGYLFSIDVRTLLGANSWDFNTFDQGETVIEQNQLINIPISCSCEQGIRKASSITYKAKEMDSLLSIASDIYGGLVSAQQIAQANNLSTHDSLVSGQNVTIPFPCACQNNRFKGRRANFLTYTIQAADSLAKICSRYGISNDEFLILNNMESSSSLLAGDVVVLPLPVCIPTLDPHTLDFGLSITNGSYVVTANGCVKCNCAYNLANVHCTSAPPNLSDAMCPMIKCGDTHLSIGEFSTFQHSNSCYIQTCNYDGYDGSRILTRVAAFTSSRCPVAPSTPYYMPLGSAQIPSQPSRPLTLPISSSSSGFSLSSCLFYPLICCTILISNIFPRLAYV